MDWHDDVRRQVPGSALGRAVAAWATSGEEAKR